MAGAAHRGAATSANLRPLADGVCAAAPPLAFALALSPVLFSYLGWNASVFVASEIRDPGRNVPRSLFVGLGLCIALYLALNAVVPLRAAGGDAVAARRTPARLAAEVLFGPRAEPASSRRSC